MSQPAAGGAACRVRLIASVPICMALAVHVSSNGAHVLHQRSPGWLRPARGISDQGHGQGHSDLDLSGSSGFDSEESGPMGKAAGWG